jgi:hypothetical protein
MWSNQNSILIEEPLRSMEPMIHLFHTQDDKTIYYSTVTLFAKFLG